MKRQIHNYGKFIALVAALPFIYGCGGAGVGSLVGFLFGGGGLTGSQITLLASSGGGLGGGAGLATLHQPEPASMMLVGGGLMAMGYFKSKVGRRSK